MDSGPVFKYTNARLEVALEGLGKDPGRQAAIIIRRTDGADSSLGLLTSALFKGKPQHGFELFFTTGGCETTVSWEQVHSCVIESLRSGTPEIWAFDKVVAQSGQLQLHLGGRRLRKSGAKAVGAAGAGGDGATTALRTLASE